MEPKWKEIIQGPKEGLNLKGTKKYIFINQTRIKCSEKKQERATGNKDMLLRNQKTNRKNSAELKKCHRKNQKDKIWERTQEQKRHASYKKVQHTAKRNPKKRDQRK